MGMSMGSNPVSSGRSRRAAKYTVNIFKSVRYTETARIKIQI
jgi:hypothetical protein